MSKKEFWKWLKYTIRNGGECKVVDKNLPFYGDLFCGFELHLNGVKLGSIRRHDVARFNWIERL